MEQSPAESAEEVRLRHLHSVACLYRMCKFVVYLDFHNGKFNYTDPKRSTKDIPTDADSLGSREDLEAMVLFQCQARGLA